MTKLSETYGEIYALQLGTIRTVVLSSLSTMKETLVEKGSSFGDRPNFLRYHVLFGDDKENSLAFCNWSSLQKTRRALARKFCHSGVFTDRVEGALEVGAEWLLGNISSRTNSCQIKTIINKTCGIIFFNFFCSQLFLDDPQFDLVLRKFDEIFWEINQNHPVDVFPKLSIFFSSYLNNLANLGKSIRTFVVERIINPHLEKLDKDNPEDFVDMLLMNLEEEEPEKRLSMVQVLYELEDFLGGHSAVSNLLLRALIEIASVDGLSKVIYDKCVTKSDPAFMKGILYETLRKSSSPIVPHVASEKTSIGEYEIEKDTMILFNNYKLNMNAELWHEPEKFNPGRFITESGEFRKPSYFIPFSTGKRGCMGYRLVEKLTEGLLLAIVGKYDLTALDNPTKMPLSCVALNPDSEIRIAFVPRTI